MEKLLIGCIADDFTSASDTASFLVKAGMHGICSIMTTLDAPMSLNTALENAEEMYYNVAIRMLRMVNVGRALPQ